MATVVKDPLLSAARIIIYIMMGFIVIAGVACLIATPFVLVMSDTIIAEAAQEGFVMSYTLVLGIAALLLLVVGSTVAIFLFLRRLLWIIASVGQGDPFIPENADRLQQMAWISVILQVLAIVIGTMGAWVEYQMEEVTIDASFSPMGILTILLLFILARVFRKGTEMRDELEGTV